MKPPRRMSSISTLQTLAIEGQSGRRWYRDAIRPVGLAALALGVSPEVLCDVLAITSPRVIVYHNVRIAKHYCRTGSLPSGVIPGTIAAMTHWKETGEIRCPKTAPFARALMGDQSAIVLDVWMSRALGIAQNALGRQATQAQAEKRVRKVADNLNWTPAETQAAIWAAVVRRAGRNPASMAEHLAR